MHSRQQEIAAALHVCAPFTGPESVQTEIERRIRFIQSCLRESGMKTLVLGISGGVDSLTAGLLAQRAVKELRESTGDNAYRFIAVRLPHNAVDLDMTYFDERSFHLNDEASLNIYDRDFALAMTEVFERDMRECEIYDHKKWSERPWTEKFMETVIIPLRSQL